MTPTRFTIRSDRLLPHIDVEGSAVLDPVVVTVPDDLSEFGDDLDELVRS